MQKTNFLKTSEFFKNHATKNIYPVFPKLLLYVTLPDFIEIVLHLILFIILVDTFFKPKNPLKK